MLGLLVVNFAAVADFMNDDPAVCPVQVVHGPIIANVFPKRASLPAS